MITSDFKMDLINKSISVLYSGPCDWLVLVLQLPSLFNFQVWKNGKILILLTLISSSSIFQFSPHVGHKHSHNSSYNSYYYYVASWNQPWVDWVHAIITHQYGHANIENAFSRSSILHRPYAKMASFKLFFFHVVQFQKISILPHRRDWNFLGGGGFCKTKK